MFSARSIRPGGLTLTFAVGLVSLFLISACGAPPSAAQTRVSTAPEQLPRLTPAPGVAGSPERGRTTFVEKGCVTCHTLQGVPSATGVLGPNLTNVSLRPTLTEASFPNTPDQMARWLMNPPAMKPGTIMPNLGLTDQQAQDLVALLYSYPYNAQVR
ncbi:MAG: c-type cytochrome [Chloroflexi bacterium]|nr:c-type cytochrome [Chloroflexota bacterium]